MTIAGIRFFKTAITLLLAAASVTCVTATALAGDWSQVASTEVAHGNPIYYYPKAVEFDGKLYLLGAEDDSATQGTVELYDPQNDSWSKAAPVGDTSFSAVVTNDTLYAAARVNNQSKILKYDATADNWVEVADAPIAYRGIADMVALDGRLMFVHSQPIPRSYTVGYIAVSTYDIVNGGWSTDSSQAGVQVQAIPDPGCDDRTTPDDEGFAGRVFRTRMKASHVAANGLVYIIGGQEYNCNDFQNDAIASVRMETFNPTTGELVAAPSLPAPVSGAPAAHLDGKIYVFGIGVTHVYNIVDGVWSTDGGSPVQTTLGAAGALDGSLYVVGGVDSNWQGKTEVFKFSPGVPVAKDLYRIRNLWQSTLYLHTQDRTGYVQVGSIYDTWDSAQWYIEDWGESWVRIQNVWTGKYMHVEEQTGLVQYGDIYDVWESAKWVIEDFDGHKRLRNYWKYVSQYVHIEDLTGEAQCTAGVYDSWSSAQWDLEPVE